MKYTPEFQLFSISADGKLIVRITPKKEWGAIRSVTLVYYATGPDGVRRPYSEPLRTFHYPCAGEAEQCFDPSVSEAQQDVGVCVAGKSICQADGWVCMGGGAPLPEADCTTPEVDENCDGFEVNPGVECECLDGESEVCPFPPDIAWKAGVGICEEVSRECMAGIWGTCDLNFPAEQEDCDTETIDDNCDGVDKCGKGVSKIVAGRLHTCALLDSGEVLCWGDTSSGVLGVVGIKAYAKPGFPVELGAGVRVIDIAAGLEHTCALLETHEVKCWGAVGYGQLGYADGKEYGFVNPPSAAGFVAVGGPVEQIVAGHSHTCVLREDGKVLCWGWGKGGRLGYGDVQNIGDGETPVSRGPLPLVGSVVSLAAGGAHTCALFDGGGVKCWGSGYAGQLGSGSTEDLGDDETLESLKDIVIEPVVELTANAIHTCARLQAGGIRCWGDNGDGRLGYDPANPEIGDDEDPQSMPILDLGGPVLSITAGQDFTCARLAGDEVKCWGINENGQLGQGDTVNRTTDLTNLPAIDLGDGVHAVDITAGWRHVCARTSGSSGKCWGDGEKYQLGNGGGEDIGDGPGELEHLVSVKIKEVTICIVPSIDSRCGSP